jgi:hypothetical protein
MAVEQPDQITIQTGDTVCTRSYRIESQIVKIVADDYGSEEGACIDEADPRDLAQVLLREMVRRKEDL